MPLRDPVGALCSGDLVMVVDPEAVEGGAELWLAAESAEAIAFARLVRHTTGFVTVALPAARAAALGLPAMVRAEASFTESRPVQAITCDAAEGISTGISAADRALTARLLADAASTPDDFKRPGHVVPVRVRDGLTNAASTASAALEMCAIAGLAAAMIRCEIVLDSGALAGAAEALEMARTLRVPVVDLRDIAPLREAIPLSA